MSWEINTDLIQDWLDTLDDKTYLQVLAALEVLAADGPRLGRPLVDTSVGFPTQEHERTATGVRRA